MMANRKLPFGYEMRRGIICVKAAEASIVREIYAAYIRGMSYRQIMDGLNAQTVPYSESSRSWNKTWWRESSAMNSTQAMRPIRQFCPLRNTDTQSAQNLPQGSRLIRAGKQKQSGCFPDALSAAVHWHSVQISMGGPDGTVPHAAAYPLTRLCRIQSAH